MEEMEPWQPIAIMFGYLITAGTALFFWINKYYNNKFEKMKTDRAERKKRLQELRRRNNEKL